MFHSPARRLISLDIFRGMAIAGMILVNCPGTDDIYPSLQHADWHGYTFADFIFPAFLVIMGVSLAISLGRRLDRGEAVGRILPQMLRRMAVIFALGLISNGVLYEPSTGVRVMGVLQRIALCYFCCALLFLTTDPWRQAWAAVLFLVGYWVLMTQASVPGWGKGVLTPEGNLASYLDRQIFGKHMFRVMYDPEGLLSTFPAAATALFGVLAGQWLRSRRRSARKVAGLASTGIVCAAVGRFWGLSFPINKNIWTSSFALFTGGAALTALAFCYWVVETQQIKTWAKPFEIFGRNPLLAYFLSGLFYGLQEFVGVPMPDGTKGNVKLWLTAHLFSGWLPPQRASLAYALTYLLLCLGLMAVFHRRKIFLKI